MKNCEFILFTSPISGSGQTTIANYVGLELAVKNKLVLLIEFDRFYSSTNKLHRRVGAATESLKAVLERPDTVTRNLVKSPHNSNFFYLAQPPQNGLADMIEYTELAIDRTLEQVQQNFDYVLIDSPASVEDPAISRLLSSAFSLTINKCILTMTEDTKSVILMKALDKLYYESNNARIPTTVVINKSRYLYNDYLERSIIGYNKFKALNLLNVIDLEQLTVCLNSGQLYELGNTPKANEFLLNMTQIAETIFHNETGIGLQKGIALEQIKENKLKKSTLTHNKEISDSLINKKIEKQMGIIRDETLEEPEQKSGLLSGLFKKKDKSESKLDKKEKKAKKDKNKKGNKFSKQELPENNNLTLIQESEEQPIQDTDNIPDIIQDTMQDTANDTLEQNEQSFSLVLESEETPEEVGENQSQEFQEDNEEVKNEQ